MFPELTITGLSAARFAAQKEFHCQNLAVLERLAAATGTDRMSRSCGGKQSPAGTGSDQLCGLLQNGKNFRRADEICCLRMTYFDERSLFRAGHG